MKARGKERKIAITVWGERVSPVFDAAHTLLIAEIDGQTLVSLTRLNFDPQRPLELLQLLHTQQVRLIICGAVSEGPATMLESAGVRLIPFITGEIDQVLAQYLLGRPFGIKFCMPGCGRGRCCRKGMPRSGRSPVICDRQTRRASGNGCAAKQRNADDDMHPSRATTDGGTVCQE